ncbi:hypothetical protein R1flu_017026 [Riccia fluitans]|uniref:Uncharacterized protein n=1 Tax=Riccia fluitans TaxID=41844 RepID=A0ABD1YNW3_9MARC
MRAPGGMRHPSSPTGSGRPSPPSARPTLGVETPRVHTSAWLNPAQPGHSLPARSDNCGFAGLRPSLASTPRPTKPWLRAQSTCNSSMRSVAGAGIVSPGTWGI